MKKLAIIGSLALAMTAAVAQVRFDNMVREDFFAGFAGDSARLEKGMKACEDALAANPKNGAAMVWHGSGMMFQAGPYFRNADYARGKQLLYDGLKQMNDAVALDPKDLQTLIPRGTTLLATAHHVEAERAKPLLEIAVADYEKVLDLEKPYFGQSSVHNRGELIGGLADGYRLLGNNTKAAEFLERMVKELPGTPYEKQARRWINNLAAVGRQERFCLGCHTESAAK
jgi:tetratricopeptide (TPR) repeat protein